MKCTKQILMLCLYPLCIIAADDTINQQFYISSYVTEKLQDNNQKTTPQTHNTQQLTDIGGIHDIDYTYSHKSSLLTQDNNLVDIEENQDVDYTYFNAPYIFEQYTQQPMYDLTKIQLSEEAPSTNKNPIVDLSETNNVDFSYFNDPYAFDKFRVGLPIKAKFSGYVQYSSWWDSRQVDEGGDGYFLLYPAKRKFDVDCRDINARGEFNMSIIETRTRAEFFGPKVVGADTSAYIENDLYGDSLVINRWRIRHAFLKLTWPKAEVLLGQFWHPLFVVKTFPLTLSYNAGVPIEPFSRDPQMRLVISNNKDTDNKGTELLLAATTQLTSMSNGPIGLSTTYQRNSRLPELTVRLSYESQHNYIGCGFNFLRLKPRLESNKDFKVHESINSLRFFAFNTIKFDPLEVRYQLTYAQNANNLNILGGFAVSSLNPTTDERTYTNLSSIGYWLDINISRKIEPGIFIGIAKNLGSSRNIIQCIFDPETGEEEKTIYGLYGLYPDGDQIDTVFRISPRVRFHVLPIDFAVELEYTRAGYGCINNHGRVDNVDPVGNIRLLLTTYYYF